MENKEDKVETGHRGEVVLQQPQHCVSFEFSTALLHIYIALQESCPFGCIDCGIFGRTGEQMEIVYLVLHQQATNAQFQTLCHCLRFLILEFSSEIATARA